VGKSDENGAFFLMLAAMPDGSIVLLIGIKPPGGGEWLFFGARFSPRSTTRLASTSKTTTTKSASHTRTPTTKSATRTATLSATQTRSATSTKATVTTSSKTAVTTTYQTTVSKSATATKTPKTPTTDFSVNVHSEYGLALGTIFGADANGNLYGHALFLAFASPSNETNFTIFGEPVPPASIQPAIDTPPTLVTVSFQTDANITVQSMKIWPIDGGHGHFEIHRAGSCGSCFRNL
jgi:hypothetical protein